MNTESYLDSGNTSCFFLEVRVDIVSKLTCGRLAVKDFYSDSKKSFHALELVTIRAKA